MKNKKLIDFFLEIAKINALSENEKPLADYIKSFLSKLNFQVEEDNSQQFTGSNTGNIICKVGNGGDFVLISHLDTARPTMNVNPIISDEKITSSGDTVLGVDNRVGVSVLLNLLERISREKIIVKDFTVAFTTCEESTLLGSKNLELDEKIKYGFVFDSGYRPGDFIYSACGSIGFSVKILGKASHSGISPENGINSMQVAAKVISQLPLGRIDEETTMNIGILKSGSAVNVIPELAELEGEIRSFNLQKVEDYFEEMKKLFYQEADKIGAKIEIMHFWDFLPYTISENSYSFKEISRVLTNVGLVPIPKISLGGSDANSLNGRGIQSVNIGIGAQNPHSNDEFIFIEDLLKTAEIAMELVKKEEVK